jgi:hypothetical protein
MPEPRRALALSATLIASAAMLLAGCSSPSPTPGGDGGNDQTEAPAPVNQPAWYGTVLDDDNCPVPAVDATIVRLDLDEFLQTSTPAGWCTYGSTEYVQYYALPVSSGTDFGAEVRSALEPAGWAFDPADDDSPQWSWATEWPEGTADDFEDGGVDGSIFTVPAATQDDIDTYSIWFSGLPTAFGGDWAEGDEISVLGFW